MTCFFVPYLKLTTEVFDPLILAIKRLEANNASVFEIWPKFFNLYNIYKEMTASTSNSQKRKYFKTMNYHHPEHLSNRRTNFE